MRKSTSYVLTLCLSFSLLAPYATTVKADTYSEPQFGSPISVRLGYTAFQKSSYSFTINGNYSIEGKNDLLLTNGTYTINNNNGTIQLIQNGNVLYSAASQIVIFPINYDRSSYVTLGSYNFLGDITFRANGSYVLPVNTLEQEDYLIGVVGAEMSNSWGNNGGEEALKAQAITARTYSHNDIGKEIDNGQSYQVYNGFNSNYQNVINAVDSTREQLIAYNGTSIDGNAFFSSSNGGEMLSKINSWGTASWNNIPYLTRNADPYDARSGSSNTNWSFTLNNQQIDLSNLDLTKPETWWNTVQENSADSSIISSLKSFIKRYQTQYASYDLKILSINQLSFTNYNDNPTAQTELDGHINISYIAYNPSTNTYVKNSDGTIQVQTFDKTTRTYDYYLYSAFGSGVLKSPNIKSVVTSSTQYTVNGGGWGHGIGLSQWGAYQRSIEGQNAPTILSFYYPGTTLTPYVPKPVTNTTSASGTNAIYATANESINLRETGSWSGTVITVINTGQEMQVLDTSSSWYKVSFNSQIGYVNQAYITIENTTAPAPTPAPTLTTTAPVLNILGVKNTQDSFSGSYSIDQNSNVSISLIGPNGFNKLTFANTLDKGTYSFGGPLSQAPAGNYTVQIAAEANGLSTVKTTSFTKVAKPTLTVSDINTTISSFSGNFTVGQSSRVVIYLHRDGVVNKPVYDRYVSKGTNSFSGSLTNQLPSGIYTMQVMADNGSLRTFVDKTFYLNNGTPTSINVKKFSFYRGVYYGTYSIDKNSTVTVSLLGPNWMNKTLYSRQYNAGTYAFVGNMAYYHRGYYAIMITTKNQYGLTSIVKKPFTY